MFKSLRDGIASILKGRGISIQNQQGRQGGFGGIFDAEIGAHHQHWASNGLRRAILGEGEKRAVPISANVMQCPVREIGRKRTATSGVQTMTKYLTDGALDREDT
jgi:hypothetical protein